MCVISVWEQWLKTPKEQNEWGPLSPRFIWCHASPKPDPKCYKAPQPALTSWCKISAKETFTLLLFLVSQQKKEDLLEWLWKMTQEYVLRVSNDSWFFFLKLNVIDCNYKASINDQLGDGLRGWKEGTNAIKMLDAQLCLIGMRRNACKRKITILLKSQKYIAGPQLCNKTQRKLTIWASSNQAADLPSILILICYYI